MDTYHEESLRRDIVRTSHALHARGWVANHDGNLSARLDEPGEPLRLLCTPTAVSKGDVRPEWLLVVDEERRVLQGRRRVFSEIALHLAAYRARPDIGVVLHAHPPHVCGFAVAGRPIPHPFMAEAVVSLGPTIPHVPFRRPGDPALLDALADALQRADVVVLEQHGLITVGGGFEQALLRMELVEHLARIALVAEQLGGVRRLSADDVAALSRKGRPPSDPPRPGAERPEPRKDLPATHVSPATRADVRAAVEEALRRFR
ncbi:MAG: class II aldolase/adducin family protein [Deltaproteobacteria bacterium]|nr:MAG: class II aldolase/adducin family protein [Deltaproteobacteria bacterium]